ncbi:putative SOS response-associated peptidase YedK [Trueperella bonasi]|uniref:Abasic site processing protein n=1 Tax=Trueperella bonasi TaxID=312286 RepID=A0ABT9NHE7_9ACTO|nr:SOS response-associated peptidase [Trueperella bonasi]MDP9806826.1 putative SOS response-associated peptidase YedK [Trueperella bonasi]
MCGRYATTMSRTDLQLEFRLEAATESYEPPPNYNVAPTQTVPIVVIRKPLDDDERLGQSPAAQPAEASVVRALNPAFWGLIAPWAQDLSRPMINARMETLTEKKMFAPSLKSRRCIIPASGYFEWRKPEKTPFYIFRADGRPLAFAGLYSWYNTGDDWLLTCTIITREAEGAMAEIHNRVPLILDAHEYDTWLDPTLTDPAIIHQFERPHPELAYHQVHKAVGNVRNNLPGNIMPVQPAE